MERIFWSLCRIVSCISRSLTIMTDYFSMLYTCPCMFILLNKANLFLCNNVYLYLRGTKLSIIMLIVFDPRCFLDKMFSKLLEYLVKITKEVLWSYNNSHQVAI